MKKVLIIIGIGAVSLVNAQTKKTTTTKKSVTSTMSAPVFKNSLDSFSYAIGVQGASFYKSQGAKNVNTEFVKKAFNDVFNNKQLLLTTEVCNTTVQNKMQEFMSSSALTEKEAGKTFLAENKKRQGVVELPNGLQYEILKAGTGEIPKATDTVKAHYAGSLINGQEFDNSYKRGEPLQIPVGGVIQGWVQALQMMPVGSKWKLYIPSDLGYGDRGAGGAIPGGATLIFEIELLEIVNK
ncbi:MAG: FKBP-type peptidyl-prolyl cis-trans isomerase [Ginsengibacter sp.]